MCSFNIASAGFKFFGERITTRPKFEDQALRCAVISAALACLALNRALEPLQFADAAARRAAIRGGIAFGDSGNGQSLKNLRTVLDVIADHVVGGKPIAAQVRRFFEELPDRSRADVVADHFAQDAPAQKLFSIAREFDRWAFRVPSTPVELTIDAKATLGVLADFVKVERKNLLAPLLSVSPAVSSTEVSEPESGAAGGGPATGASAPKLL